MPNDLQVLKKIEDAELNGNQKPETSLKFIGCS
jgi:hypothetical protein